MGFLVAWLSLVTTCSRDGPYLAWESLLPSRAIWCPSQSPPSLAEPGHPSLCWS